MDLPVELSVVIPAYNEAERLGTPLHAVLEFLRSWRPVFEVLVVNDGSGDATAELVRRVAAGEPRVRLIELDRHRGKGAAVRAGLLAARGGAVLLYDADGATPIEMLREVWPRLDGADLVVGSRRMPGSVRLERQTVLRRILADGFNRLASWLLGLGVRDVTCGFKLMRGDVAREIASRLRREDWTYDAELLALARERGDRVVETPVRWRAVPGSRVRLGRDVAGSVLGLGGIFVRMRAPVLAALALTMLLLAPGVGHAPFFADDYAFIAGAGQMTWGELLGHRQWGWPYGPGTGLYFRLLAGAFGASGWGFGAAGLLLHLANVALVYGIARRWLRPWSAAWVALFMGIAPPQYRPVLSISDQPKCMAALLALAAMRTGLTEGPLRFRSAASQVGLYLASLFTYPMAALLPAVLIALDRLAGRGAMADRVRWAAFACVAGLWWVAGKVAAALGEPYHSGMMVWSGGWAGTAPAVLRSAVGALARVWYDFPGQGAFLILDVVKIALAIGMGGIAARAAVSHDRGRRLAGWWVIAALLPIVTKGALDRHHLYFLVPGLALLAALDLGRSRPAQVCALLLLGAGGWTTLDGASRFRRAGDAARTYLAAVRASHPDPAAGETLTLSPPPRMVEDIVIWRDGRYVELAAQMMYGDRTLRVKHGTP